MRTGLPHLARCVALATLQQQPGGLSVRSTPRSTSTELAMVSPNVVGHGGGYHQWSSTWKVSVRFGVQSFGALLPRLTSFQSFTLPIIRLDVDRMDDNDDRLFGVRAEIARVPKPSYQLTLRTPLYAVRHRSAKKSLTRRANHLHIFILQEFWSPRPVKTAAGFFNRTAAAYGTHHLPMSAPCRKTRSPARRRPNHFWLLPACANAPVCGVARIHVRTRPLQREIGFAPEMIV